MILIPDSDDDKLGDDNKNPFLTEAQKENFKKEWAHEKKVEELQGMQHVTRQPIFHATGVFFDAFSCTVPLVSF